MPLEVELKVAQGVPIFPLHFPFALADARWVEQNEGQEGLQHRVV